MPWRLLPHDYPPRRSVYDQVRRWRQAGLWGRINAALRDRTRALAGRPSPPHLAVIDSQTARTGEAGGERGYDGGERVSGRKRHLGVDSQGLVLHVCVHPASLHDRRAAETVLAGFSATHPTIKPLFGDRAWRA